MITMTIYKIESDLVDVTPLGRPPASVYLPSRTFVSAQGEGERHYWPLRDDERCWIGDTVRVQVIEDDQERKSSIPDPLTPPPINKRGNS